MSSSERYLTFEQLENLDRGTMKRIYEMILQDNYELQDNLDESKKAKSHYRGMCETMKGFFDDANKRYVDANKRYEISKEKAENLADEIEKVKRATKMLKAAQGENDGHLVLSGQQGVFFIDDDKSE